MTSVKVFTCCTRAASCRWSAVTVSREALGSPRVVEGMPHCDEHRAELVEEFCTFILAIAIVGEIFLSLLGAPSYCDLSPMG